MRLHRTGKYWLLIGLIALFCTLAPAMAEVTYTVRAGDTLSKIAMRLSVPLATLRTLNNIHTRKHLRVGRIIRIPEKDVPAVSPPAQTDQLALLSLPTPPAISTLSGLSVLSALPALSASPAPQQSADAPDAQSEPSPQLTGRELIEERTRLLLQQENAHASSLVASALALTGTPYRWGGLSARGLDCSGLVVRAMYLEGKRVPHHAASLFTMGTHVGFEELQPGDLVFFVIDRRTVSHVGIWVGDNKFIHASCARGVIIDEMKGYYARHLAGARRL